MNSNVNIRIGEKSIKKKVLRDLLPGDFFMFKNADEGIFIAMDDDESYLRLPSGEAVSFNTRSDEREIIILDADITFSRQK